MIKRFYKGSVFYYNLHIYLDEDDIQAIKAVTAEEKRKERVLAEINVDDDSEEELTTTVGEKDLNVSKSKIQT